MKKGNDTNFNQDAAETALILGGSSGLGLATAKKLARHGYDIVIVHRDRRSDIEEVESHFQEITSRGVSLHSFNLDAVNAEKRNAMISQLKELLGEENKVKVLVHSLAKGNLKPMQSEREKELDHQDFQITLDAMAISLYDWTKALVDAGLFAADARIVSFTSEGNTKAWANYGAVSAAKAALEAITRNIALEFAPSGIKANCIQAGVTDTKSFRSIPGSELLKGNALERNPSGRLTTPQDVANVVYLLTTQEAKWITGTVIKVDGGESLR
ncbi:SDR family oxidoreductase [Flavobacteriaceae bacterium TP-CH-4]|uniref:SDR family oxidoreductase n=1 Tax=Pelagihabitans pacificus TaxID=2696054 RepID=A0A967AVT6_9FLAO|nr:SDR family oxidoreductase [Pelagihabitans pacificus]NHF60013.1 SDR family oxidoreductase [Pelagihabitans pacificus]